MKLIVTGTGRSGTAFMCKLFNRLGVPCGHEEVFGIIGFQGWGDLMADSTFCALPYLQSLSAEDHIIYHVVRDPMEGWISQLSSHWGSPVGQELGGFWWRDRGDTEVGPWFDFIHENIEFGSLHDPFLKSVFFMHQWTMETDAEARRFKHSFTNRLEDLKISDINCILDIMNVEPEISVQQAIESVDIKENSRPRVFDRDDLYLDDPLYVSLRRFYDSI